MLFKKAAFLSLMLLAVFTLVSFGGDDTFTYSEKIILNTSSGNEELKGDIKNLPVLILKRDGGSLTIYSAVSFFLFPSSLIRFDTD